jgi:hypothetical protein
MQTDLLTQYPFEDFPFTEWEPSPGAPTEDEGEE